jgi:hypothetical protein
MRLSVKMSAYERTFCDCDFSLTGSLLDRNDCSYPAFLFIWLFGSLFPRKTLWLEGIFGILSWLQEIKSRIFNTLIPFYFISSSIHNLLFSCRFISYSYRFALNVYSFIINGWFTTFTVIFFLTFYFIWFVYFYITSFLCETIKQWISWQVLF